MSASYTQGEVRRLLLQHLPRGAERLYDLSTSSNIGKIWSALADTFKAYGYDMIDTLRAEIFPASATAKLAEWGKALKLTSLLAWRNGTEAQRAAVIARLRESGSYSLPEIRAVVGVLLGYADPNDLEILETSRADLTAINTYDNGTGVNIVGGGTEPQNVIVADAPAVSQAGARVEIVNFNASDDNDVTFTLTGPDSTAKTWTGNAYFRNHSDPLSLWAPEFASAAIEGTWTLEASSASGDVSFDSWSLIVEAIGWQSAMGGAQGLGSEVFNWAVVVDPTLEGVAAPSDREAARAALHRVKPAHTQAFLVLRMSGGGLCAIFDEAGATFDGCAFC